jgi:hypothetical protein
MQLLDRLRYAVQRSRGVIEQGLLLLCRHLADQCSWLQVIAVVDTMVPLIRRAFNRQRWFAKVRLLLPLAPRIRLIWRGATCIGITSRSKLANVSRNQTSCSSAGPFRAEVMMFWLSTTGAPNAVVNFFTTPFLYVN